MIHEVECRRCGGKFETDDDALVYICDACNYADWHDYDDDELEEGEEIAFGID